MLYTRARYSNSWIYTNFLLIKQFIFACNFFLLQFYIYIYYNTVNIVDISLHTSKKQARLPFSSPLMSTLFVRCSSYDIKLQHCFEVVSNALKCQLIWRLVSMSKIIPQSSRIYSTTNIKIVKELCVASHLINHNILSLFFLLLISELIFKHKLGLQTD